MKPTLFLFAFLISDAALAQEAGSCKLLSEDKHARVWQCPPTPSPSNVSGPPVSTSTPSDSTKR